jgi:ABC-type amino acid transport system permease subunit
MILNIDVLHNFLYILKGLFLTLLITGISLFIGILLGFLIGVLIFIKFNFIDILLKKKINNSFIDKLPCFYQVLNLYQRLTINTPLITQLFLISYVLPFNINAFTRGLIVLGLNSAAHISVIILESLNNISEIQWNTSISLGFSPMEAIKKIFIKMIINNNKKRLFQEFIALLKESSILSYFGIKEITNRSREISFETYNFLPYMLFVSGLYFFIITISEYLYEKFLNKN